MSRTRTRIKILEAFEQARAPLSGKQIRSMVPVKCDLSTVYRTLNILFEKGILQRVIVDHEVKFALKRDSDNSGDNAHDHLHFKCSSCDTLFCLTEVTVKDFKLPDGFVKEENQFLVIGKCRKCQ